MSYFPGAGFPVEHPEVPGTLDTCCKHSRLVGDMMSRTRVYTSMNEGLKRHKGRWDSLRKKRTTAQFHSSTKKSSKTEIVSNQIWTCFDKFERQRRTAMSGYFELMSF